MGHTTRQFNALTKKNFISYVRTPCCAVFQILCPGMLMLILVYIRTRITATTPVYVDYELFKTPFFPGLEYTGGGEWSTAPIDFLKTNAREEAFMVYDNYTNANGTYNLLTDFTGPLFFFPSQCDKSNSVVIPKQPSWVVAVVGPPNPIQDAVTSYLQTINELQILSNPNQTTNPVPAYNFTNFATQEDMFAYISNENYLNVSAGFEGICFGYQITPNAANSYEVQMYFNDQTEMGGPTSVGIPSQYPASWNPTQSEPRLTNYLQYATRGYATIQNLIANLVLKETTGDNTATISLMAVPEQAEQKQLDAFSQVLSGILPLLMLFMYILPVFTIVSLIVKEKESKARESMRMMGMTDSPYWLSWFAYYTILNTILSLIAWAVLCINVIGFSNPIFVFLWIWLYGQAIFGEIVFMQSLFSRAKYSGLISAVVYFTLVLANIPVQSENAQKGTRLVLSLIPQVALQQICTVYAGFESANVGIHKSTINEWYFNYTFLEGLLLLFVALPLWTFLGLYLDKVLPREYGRREKWNFVCSPSFWGCRRNQGREITEEDRERRSTLQNTGRESVVDNFEAKNLKPEYYEPVAADIAKMELEDKFLQISDLKKTYANGFQAVKGINVKMYQGQIFALLGQNGAGKTTTISMITGLLVPSEGDASCYELDVFKDMPDVRRFMGICPQHDVLFELLTPLEHLDLFYELKNGDPLKKQKEVDDLVREVGLTTDKDKMAGTLSGGNKRKLSVSIAIIGQSKLVLLDEPTSGMDLGARRGLWNMLRKYRRDRIIILTTHYMDEADVLGDRIGIMAHGQLKCLGSSLFLKNKFGGGYKLVMVKKFKTKNKVVMPFLQQYFGKVELLSEISSEITFGIPKEYRNMFQEFFKAFDDKIDELEIKSYGISITTLEEVFLAINAEERDELSRVTALKEIGALDDNRDEVAMIEEQQTPKLDHINATNLMTSQVADEGNFVSEENLTRGSGILTNNYALLTKRINIYRRDRCGLFCEILCPFIMVLIGCGFSKITFLHASSPRYLIPEQYPLPQRIAMNAVNVIPPTVADQQPDLFFNNLPNVTEAFQLTTLNDTSYYGYYNAVNAEQNVGKMQPYRYGSYQIFNADGVKHKYQVNAQLNLTSQDVTALYPQFMYESILKTATNDSNFQFNVTTTPYPLLWVFLEREKAGNAFDFAFMVGIGLSLIPTVIVSFILREREENLKHMQLISGMNLTGYWTSNTIADITKAYVPILLIIVLTWIFNTNYQGVWVLYLLFPWAIVMFSYVFSFFFSSDTSAQISIFAINFLVSGIMAITVITLQIIPQTEHLGNQLRWWFCLVPSFCVTHGIIFSSSSALLLQAQPNLNPKIWAWQNLGGDAVCLILWFVVGLIFLTVVESDIFSCLRKLTVWSIPPPKTDLMLDEDVIAEEDRVGHQKGTIVNAQDDPESNLLDSQYDVIRVSGFRKAYTKLFGKPFLAVERISFGLDYGECFALLGVNGAGKSTTFKSLTGDVLPTTGEITISGYDIYRSFKEARKLIGYCPQKDAIFPLMTVEEHLWFYSRIKGIPQELREQIVEKSIVEMNLSEHRTKPAGTLSGGNKRKLSVAMATIGNPPIILLDEPSAGMDPEARRFMWTVVERISQRDKKSAVILTTHSMEEAEALSTKMGIMVRGGIFRCYGSSQHIKNKYGTGYEIQLKIRKTSYSDLDGILALCQFGQELGGQVNLVDAIAKAKQANFTQIILDEIKDEGLGTDLAAEALANNGNVTLESLVQYLFIQQNGIRIIDKLVRIFSSVEVIEQCADFYKLKVPRGQVTIGFLFGLLEDQKLEFNISEYSVSQTSLEQIFQQFANMEIEEKAALTFVNQDGKCVLLNPNRSSTFVQKRRATLKNAAAEDSKDYGYGDTPQEFQGSPDDLLVLKPENQSKGHPGTTQGKNEPGSAKLLDENEK